MADYEMTENQCRMAEQHGAAVFRGWCEEEKIPMHVVRECIIRGFDAEGAKADGEG